MICLESINHNTVFFKANERDIETSQGIYFVFAGIISPELLDKTKHESAGEDILLPEFTNLTRFLAEFDCKNHHMNFFGLMVALMDSHYKKYDWREQIFKTSNEILKQLQSDADKFEANYEELYVDLCFEDFFLETHSESGEPLWSKENMPNFKCGVARSINLGKYKVYGMSYKNKNHVLIGNSQGQVLLYNSPKETVENYLESSLLSVSK